LKRFLEKLLGSADADLPVRRSEDARSEDSLSDPIKSPSVSTGNRIYCIGDIHGRFDLLLDIQKMIRKDVAGFEGGRKLVYLGDYIDRGDQSKQIIDLLIEEPMEDFSTVHILGNHEQAMLDFLQKPEAATFWLAFGGLATLNSYGVSGGTGTPADDLNDLRDQLERRLPSTHMDFLNACDLYHVDGDYCFVHAGIRPEIPLEEQHRDDLLWIRGDFIDSAVQHEHVVVHGHSITREVEMHPNRIGIDTGAFHSGTLTCLVLEDASKRLLQTSRY
jgi:serine/threonine protein phosphatase 1